MRIKRIMIMLLILILAIVLAACGQESLAEQNLPENDIIKEVTDTVNREVESNYQSGKIPEEIELIQDNYRAPSEHPGTLNRLTYHTWESFTYDEHSQELTKDAWVYLPYEYDPEQKYNVFYLSHGGWSNETTIMGTDTNPNSFKNVIDHAVEDVKMRPMILVMVTYNNTDGQDSWDYSLAIKLTDQFHKELVNDIIPAVEGKYSTYAADTTKESLITSRDHRGFGGFSMGSVNTWCTFRYAMDYFRYFMPMSGNYGAEGRYMAKMVTDQGYTAEDFFIFSMSGPDDFAYSGIKSQIQSMAANEMFTYGDNEKEGNLAWREMAGFQHGPEASDMYTYNGLRFFWKGEAGETDGARIMKYIKNSLITDVINDPSFDGYGRLIFPVNSGYYSGNTLRDLHLTWYSNIQPDKTVEIVNYMKSHAEAGDTIFYDIYTDAEKEADPEKEDTGLFFFRGNPREKFAICNAGGGFAYVGAMHDSFPHALELSKKGYNAFALIYRPGAQTACEDLARAIAFIHEHAEELQVDVSDYSLWGGSAGARMAAWLGSYGTESFGENTYPGPAAVIMQYTGLSEVYGNEPPTYNCVGTRDGIASYRTMQARIDAIKANGTDAEIEVFQGLSHGFGLGTGTVAEGWLDNAIAFWERNMK